MSAPPSSSLTLMVCGGPGAWPSPGASGRNSLGLGGFVGLVLVLGIMGCRAAKASPHLLGARCISQAA